MAKVKDHKRGPSGLISEYDPDVPAGKGSHYGLAIEDSVPFEVSLVDSPAVAPATFTQVFNIVSTPEKDETEAESSSTKVFSPVLSEENTPSESTILSDIACTFSTVSDKMQVGGYVLTPFLETFYGSIINPTEIENACHKFMSSLTHGSTNSTDGIGHMHHTFGGYGYPIEIFYDTEGLYGYKDSWYMKVQVTDHSVWQKIKNNQIRGFSVGFKTSASIMGHDYYFKTIFDNIPDFSFIGATPPKKNQRGYTNPPSLYPSDPSQYGDPTNFLYPCSTSAQTICCLHYLAVDNPQVLNIYSESEKAFIFKKLCETAQAQGIDVPLEVQKKLSMGKAPQEQHSLGIKKEATSMDNVKETATAIAEELMNSNGLIQQTLTQFSKTLESKNEVNDQRFSELDKKMDALTAELTALKEAKTETKEDNPKPVEATSELSSIKEADTSASVYDTEELSKAINAALTPKVDEIASSFKESVSNLTEVLNKLQEVQSGTDLSQQLVQKEQGLSADESDIWAGTLTGL